ncbi:MAG: sigma-70 family RNA polymerase sigma factor [Bacilli bacterium]
MDFDTIIKDIEEKLESGTMKLEYLSYILNKNKIEDVFTFIKKIIDKSSVIDNYLFTYLHGKKQYSEEEIYKKFGDTNGDIIFCYASIKDLIVEDNLDYSYGDSTCLYSDDLFFSEIREIPIMDKSVTNNYIEKFQKYKKLYEESENFSEKTAYEKKYVFYQNQVIEGNIRLIISIANKRLHSNIELNELVNEGTFGMIKAMEKFDPTLGFAFSTYATCWIRQSINRAIEEKEELLEFHLANIEFTINI